MDGESTYPIFKGFYYKNPVAIKEIPVTDSEAGKLTDTYNRIKNLHHPNIVFVWGIGKTNTHYSLVMSLYEQNLYDFIVNQQKIEMNEDKVSMAAKLKIAKEVALGMYYLEMNMVCHLDLKPQNILLTDTLTVKITDFDYSKSLTTEDYKVNFATPEYTPPEFFSADVSYKKIQIFLAMV